MSGNAWDTADMAIVSLRLTQLLTGLMVRKGLIQHDELAAVYGDLAASLGNDPSGAGALAYLKAITPPAVQTP